MNMDLFDDVKRMDKRQFFYQVLSFGMIVSSALMIWKGLMVVTGSESPIVVVLSGSMEPAFHRGDLLFLTNYEQEDIRVGEIVVFKVHICFTWFDVQSELENIKKYSVPRYLRRSQIGKQK